MKTALETNKIKSIYDRIAGWYDIQHTLLTARSDERGRRMLVDATVRKGDCVLDCGAGTGSTALLAARAAGQGGRVTLYDLSAGMLETARKRAKQLSVGATLTFETGDMANLPFPDNSFDVVLSTYSLCPLYDPAKGARELLRVVRPGGLCGIAHSAEPESKWVRWLATRIENAVWHLPWISMGCRSVHVLPALKESGASLVWHKTIGVPLWPFEVFVVRKAV